MKPILTAILLVLTVGIASPIGYAAGTCHHTVKQANSKIISSICPVMEMEIKM